jgi:hypothetical protein
MTISLRIVPKRLAAVALAAATLAAMPTPAMAQDSTAETRIRKIESEIRALQRKVFPGGDGRFFEPQIGPGAQTAPTATPATTAAPSTTAVTDILVRLDALEAQLQAMTARSEEQANALSLLEGRIAALEAGRGATTDLPLLPAASPQGSLSTPGIVTASVPASGATNASVVPPVATAPAATPPPAAAPSAARLAAVQAIAKPQTADLGDDEYSYGFRL